MNNRLINTKVAGGGGGCTDIVDNYDPFDGNGVALYQLNGNATDVSGNYNGTATNVTYSAGQFGQAGVFSSSRIQLPTGASSFNNKSFSLWFKYDYNSQDSFSFMFGDDITNNVSPYNGIQIWSNYSNNNNLTVRTKGGNELNILQPQNRWYHLCVTYDRVSAKIYIDGSYVNQISDTTDLSSVDAISMGGNPYDPTKQHYVGELDQVRIFNTALDPLEVEALYTEELCICGGTVDTLDILGDGSCIATYQLDGNANDLSGNYSGEATDVSYGVGEFDLCLTAGRVQNPDYNLTNQVSVSGWYKTNADGSVWALGSGGDNPLLACDTWRAYFEGNGTQSDVLSLPSVNTNAWTHIVQVIDLITHTQTVYVDKVAYSNSIPTDNTAIGNLASTNGLGTDTSSSAFSLNGLDQVRIFNKALNSTEVTTLYNETACTKAACTGTTNTLDILGDGSCIAAYPLDGSPADLSGNYNGVQTDVTYPQGYFDLAGVFNGSSSHLDLPLKPIYDGRNNITTSFWFNVSDSGRGVLFTDYAGSNDWNLIVSINRISVGDIYIETRYGGNNVANQITGTYNDGAWHCITIVLNQSTNQRITYIDNILKETTAISSASWTGVSTQRVTIGDLYNTNTSSYQGTYALDGQIDQVRIFNKALSAGEVTTLYNETPCN
jgi:hypothetical protein